MLLIHLSGGVRAAALTCKRNLSIAWARDFAIQIPRRAKPGTGARLVIKGIDRYDCTVCNLQSLCLFCFVLPRFSFHSCRWISGMGAVFLCCCQSGPIRNWSAVWSSSCEIIIIAIKTVKYAHIPMTYFLFLCLEYSMLQIARATRRSMRCGRWNVLVYIQR